MTHKQRLEREAKYDTKTLEDSARLLQNLLLKYGAVRYASEIDNIVSNMKDGIRRTKDKAIEQSKELG